MTGNYIIQGREINQQFADGMFAMYMQGLYGVQVGYKVQPLWYIGMRKELFDYQTLCSTDCNGELADLSRGHVVYNCCPSGSTLSYTSPQVNCCPKGMIYNPTSGNCISYTSSETSAVVPCLCCPDGYTYVSYIGYCQGVSAADIVEPINCGSSCIDGAGNRNGLIQCPDKVLDSVLLSNPTYGDNSTLCCETMITPWTGECGTGRDCNWNNFW